MNSNMVKREKFDHFHVVYHFTVPLIISNLIAISDIPATFWHLYICHTTWMHHRETDLYISDSGSVTTHYFGHVMYIYNIHGHV